MNGCNIRTSSPERHNSIIISQKSPTHKTRKSQDQYSLENNVFDPSNSSPPNNFMKKMVHRMSVYTMKETSRNIE